MASLMAGEPNLRLFTGLRIAGDVIGRLENALRKLRPAAALNWIPAANFHVTTVFIGSWPEPGLDGLISALSRVAAPPSFDIAIRGLGLFPAARRPRFFFAGVHAGPEIRRLHEQVSAALAPIGFTPEDRAYTPHLTLARIRNENIVELKRRIQPMSEADFGTFRASSFQLFRSVTGPRGSAYSELASFPLATAPDDGR